MLAELARLGPFFALDSHPVRSVPLAPWRPLDELLQPGSFGARASAVRAALARASRLSEDAVEPRVAASMAQLGLAARLVCPALGMAALTGGLLEVDPARMRWRPRADGTVALSIRADLVPADGPAGELADAFADALADALAARLLDGPVRTLVEAGSTVGVSEQVLWGNVSSVVHGAAALIGTAAPTLAGRAQAIVAGLLDRAPLRGTYRGHAGADFRRRSCCLIYRVAGPGAPICGDCVLDRAPGRRGPTEPSPGL